MYSIANLYKLFGKKPFSFLPLNFYKFFITGITTFLIDNTVLNIVYYIVLGGEDYEVFEKISISKFTAGFVAIMVGFYINRNWSFKETRDKKARNQITRYFLIFGINLVVASVLFPIYKDLVTFMPDRLEPSLANVITTSNIMFISYFSYRFFVFR